MQKKNLKVALVIKEKKNFNYNRIKKKRNKSKSTTWKKSQECGIAQTKLHNSQQQTS